MCSFRLVLEEKKIEKDTWGIKIRVLRKVFSQYALLDAESNISGSLNRGGTADLPLLRTLL